MSNTDPENLIDLTADIVSAFVSNNPVHATDLPDLIASVHSALTTVRAPKPEAEPERREPAVPIKKSVTDDYIICLEDGKKFKSLKRHLSTAYGMSPDDYRAKWGLSRDYPMVAPAYASARSNLARQMGLGRKSDAAGAEPANDVAPAPQRSAAKQAKPEQAMAEPAEPTVEAPKRRGRAKKAD